MANARKLLFTEGSARRLRGRAKYLKFQTLWSFTAMETQKNLCFLRILTSHDFMIYCWNTANVILESVLKNFVSFLPGGPPLVLIYVTIIAANWKFWQRLIPRFLLEAITSFNFGNAPKQNTWTSKDLWPHNFILVSEWRVKLSKHKTPSLTSYQEITSLKRKLNFISESVRLLIVTTSKKCW